MPAFSLTVWFGLSAPKGTPKPMIDKLNKALSAALGEPAVVDRNSVTTCRRRRDAARSISTNSTRMRSRFGRRFSEA
jgi:tripartite-type tricarboxylate transporter receptor subunit TctC